MRLRTRYTQRLPVAQGLRLDIPFFEGSGTKVLDVSGKGNHGTITDALWTRDENGVCMSFNGTSAYINCGNDASLNITDVITVEAWIKATSMSGASYIIDKRDGTAVAWLIYLSSGGTININGGATSGLSGDKVLNTDKWYHIVCVFSGTTGMIYIDGVLDKTINITAIASKPTVRVVIGARWDSYPGVLYLFRGTIDKVRIYASVALTAEQIKRRYEQTKRDYVRAS